MATMIKKASPKKITGGGVVRPVGTAKLTKAPLTKSAGKLTKTPQTSSAKKVSIVKKNTGGPVYETPGFKPGTRNLKKY